MQVANHRCNRELVSRIPIELSNSTVENNPIRMWTKDIEDISLKKICTEQVTIMEICSTALAIRKMKIKTTRDIITHLSEWLKHQIVIPPNAGEDTKRLGRSFTYSWWECEMVHTLWKRVRCFVFIKN